jgi:hypothetical protein
MTYPPGPKPVVQKTDPIFPPLVSVVLADDVLYTAAQLAVRWTHLRGVPGAYNSVS